MHVVVTDDESYNKKIKQRKKTGIFFFFLHGGIFDSEDDFLKNVSFWHRPEGDETVVFSGIKRKRVSGR